MDKEKLTVIEVYRATLQQAEKYRASAKELSDEGKTGTDVEMYKAMAHELYYVAGLLERTEEVNPTKK